MKMNLLKMVQLILSSMDSDEVNSISDTAESLQIVDIIESTYYDLADTLDLPDHWDFFELDPSNDINKPTLMYLPSNVASLEWVQYDVRENGETTRNMRDIIPLERREFLNRMNSYDTTNTDTYSYDLLVGSATFPILGKNDKHPTYFTTNNDRTLIFDSYDSSVDGTLMGNKTLCYGMLYPTFTREDTFIPDLVDRQFTLLFNEAKSTAFADLKQVSNAKAEQRARRGWVQAHRKSPQTGKVGRKYWDFTYDFGRRGRKYR
jgi:hypothetical protein